MMSSYINTDRHWKDLKEILKLMQSAKYLTSTDVDHINASVENNMKWIAGNLEDIETWLDGEMPSSSLPSTITSLPTTQSTETESTTLGSSSMIASFLIITICLLGKFFV